MIQNVQIYQSTPQYKVAFGQKWRYTQQTKAIQERVSLATKNNYDQNMTILRKFFEKLPGDRDVDKLIRLTTEGFNLWKINPNTLRKRLNREYGILVNLDA